MRFRRSITLVLLCVASFGCESNSEPSPGSPVEEPASNDSDDQNGNSNSNSEENGNSAGTLLPADRTRTAEQLDAYYAEQGGREAFPTGLVRRLETLLLAEDDLAAGEFASAKQRLDDIFSEFPVSDGAWFQDVGLFDDNLGVPLVYYGMRMAREIERVSRTVVRNPTETLRMTVLLAECGEGRRPTSVDGSEFEEVRISIDPALRENNYRIVSHSLGLFRQYVSALTDFEAELEVAVEVVPGCFDIGYDIKAEFSYSGIDRAADVVDAASVQARENSDMFWVLYPSNVPTGSVFDDSAFITGGMGTYGARPLFIIDDLWLVRVPPHLGSGTMSDVERRAYLPQWLQHEYFHHLYREYPEFGLEETGHQWFDRNSWPDGFVGVFEPDYYAESLAKRLRGANRSLLTMMAVAPSRLAELPLGPEQLAGRYVRAPYENGFHGVDLSVTANGLLWSNDDDVSWNLTLRGGTLETASDSPYGAQEVGIRFDEISERPINVTGLVFQGELYAREEP
ncbi:MAG: hypothetical protein AAFQ82_10415 [Myxococcota bacterium]